MIATQPINPPTINPPTFNHQPTHMVGGRLSGSLVRWVGGCHVHACAAVCTSSGGAGGVVGWLGGWGDWVGACVRGLMVVCLLGDVSQGRVKWLMCEPSTCRVENIVARSHFGRLWPMPQHWQPGSLGVHMHAETPGCGLCVCGWVGGVFDDGTEHARMWQCIDWARGGGSSSHADVELSREAPSVSTSRMLRRHVFSELCRAASVLVDPLGLALRTVVGIGGVCYNGTGRASLCQCIAWPREGAAEHLLSCLAEAPVRQQCGSCRVHSASASAELSAYDMIHVIGALQGALWYMVFLTH